MGISQALIRARVMEEAKKQLEESAQRIADLLPGHLRTNKVALSVKFPRGVIRTIKDLKPRWPYLTGERARIVACTIQLCDKNRWHLNTWEVGLTCGTMWVWHCTIPVIAVIETLMYEYGVQKKIVNGQAKLKKIIDTFQSKGIISASLRDELHELREFRNGIHLYLQDKVQIHDGKPKRYNDAVRALHEPEKAIKKYEGR